MFFLWPVACGNWGSSTKDGTDVTDCGASSCALQAGALPAGYPIIDMYGAQAPCDTTPISKEFVVLDYTFGTQGATYHCGDEYEDATARAADALRAMQAGVALWYPVTGGPALDRVTISSGGFAYGVKLGDGVQNVYYSSTYNKKFPMAAAAIGCNAPADGNDCFHDECDIIFYSLNTTGSITYDTCTVTSSGAGNMSLQTVFAHEFGHALGLGDIDATYADALMWESIGEREWKSPSADDLAAAAFLYGVR